MKKVLSVLLGLVIIACLAIYIRINILHNAVDIKIQSLQKNGIITDLSMLHNTYYAPIEQNGATLFKKAILAYQNIKKKDFRDEMPYQNDNTIILSKAKTLYQGYKKVYKILDTIPIDNRCRFDIDFNQGYLMQQNHLTNLNTFSYLLLIRLNIAIESQNISLAIRSLQKSVAILNAIREEPAVLSLVHLYRMNVNIKDGFKLLVENRKLTKQHLQTLKKIFSQIPNIDIKRYYFSEIACTVDVFRNSKKHGVKEQFFDKIKATASKTTIKHLEKWQQDYDIINSKLSITDKLEKISLSSSSTTLQGIALEQMYPLLFSFNETATLLKTSLAIETYYTNNNKLPQTLKNLIPDYLSSIPTHLITKKPFIYELNNKKNYYKLLNLDSSSVTNLKKISLIINKPNQKQFFKNIAK